MAKKTVRDSTNAILERHAVLRGRLANGLLSGRAAHAVLISGSAGIGKTAIVLEYARQLLCDEDQGRACGACIQCDASRFLQHPDLHLVFPYPPGAIKTKRSSEEGEEIDESGVADRTAEMISALAGDPFAPTMLDDSSKGDRGRMQNHSIRLPQIRVLLRRVSRKAFQARRKVYVLFHAQLMNVAAQNALLKILEEPPPNGYFLLVSESEQELLPTIRSRCQLIRAGNLDTVTIAAALAQDGVESEQANISASLSNGNFVRARELVGKDLQELQTDVINFMAESARCNPLDLPKTVARVRERLAAADRSYFDFLNLFLRDAALYGALDEAARERLIFGGLEKRISGVVKAYPEADFEAAMQAVDESADYISLGYSADFVLYALAIRIHNALGRRTVGNRVQPNG